MVVIMLFVTFKSLHVRRRFSTLRVLFDPRMAHFVVAIYSGSRSVHYYLYGDQDDSDRESGLPIGVAA